MTPEEQSALDDLRDAMRGGRWRIEPVVTFTHGPAVQVWVKRQSGRWVKAGPFLLPPEGGNLSDALATLGRLTVEATP